MSFSNDKKMSNECLPKMPENMSAEFDALIRVQSHYYNESAMVKFVLDHVKCKGYKVEKDRHGNIIVTKGEAESFPCIVSHLDTVHYVEDNMDIWFYEDGDGHEMLYATTTDIVDNEAYATGIGGDDKCGIFACFYMLEHFDNIKVMFFSQEELGCVGSSHIDFKHFDDVGYIIQLDRWGRGDFIDMYYGDKTISDDFDDIAASVKEYYGYKSEEGLITDSINLHTNSVGLSCVNVSCGYYNHHTVSEEIDSNQLYNSILFTQDLITALGEKKYPKSYIDNWAPVNYTPSYKVKPSNYDAGYEQYWAEKYGYAETHTEIYQDRTTGEIYTKEEPVRTTYQDIGMPDWVSDADLLSNVQAAIVLCGYQPNDIKLFYYDANYQDFIKAENDIFCRWNIKINLANALEYLLGMR